MTQTRKSGTWMKLKTAAAQNKGRKKLRLTGVPTSQIIMPTRGPVSQHVQAARTSILPAVTFRPQDERTTQGSQCADNTRWLDPRHISRKQQCLARARMSHPSWTHSSRRSSKPPALATHSGEHLSCCFTADHRCSPQRDMHPALSPISAKLLAQLTAFRVSKDHWRIAGSVYKHSTCHSVVHTACVMASVDNIRVYLLLTPSTHSLHGPLSRKVYLLDPNLAPFSVPRVSSEWVHLTCKPFLSCLLSSSVHACENVSVESDI